MKRPSDSARPEITLRPDVTSESTSLATDSRSMSVWRLPAMDLMGARELLISWLRTRMIRFHA